MLITCYVVESLYRSDPLSSCVPWHKSQLLISYNFCPWNMFNLILGILHFHLTVTTIIQRTVNIHKTFKGSKDMNKSWLHFETFLKSLLENHFPKWNFKEKIQNYFNFLLILGCSPDLFRNAVFARSWLSGTLREKVHFRFLLLLMVKCM